LSDLKTQTDSIVVTIVHGTWARDAKWGDEGSPLLNALHKEVTVPIEADKFVWSGDNNHQDRHLAALALYEYCVEAKARNGNKRHVIIAHSHGGNVVQYARSLSKLDQYIDLYVFLGTPFLKFQRNKHILALMAAFRLFAFVILKISFMCFFMLVVAALVSRTTTNYPITAIGVFVLLTVIGSTFYVALRLKRQMTSSHDMMRQIVRYIIAFEEPKSDMKSRIITHIFDEPFLYLQFLTWCNRVLEFVYATLHWIIRARNGIGVIMAFVLAGAFMGGVDKFIIAASIALAASLVFYVLIVIVLAFAFFLTSSGLRNNPLGLGRETFMTGLLYNISIRVWTHNLIQ
jgi:hypothetical protein